MATEDPPSMIPRIVGVLNPETAHYSVVVRVPVDLKLKYPDEPWRTGIDAIGLPKRESDKYAGYVLVDFIPASPTGESSDMLWVFEKLDSPSWFTRTHSRAGLIPSKFQSFVTETKTEYDVSPLETLTPLTGDVVLSRIEDKEGTGKARKTDVEEEITAPAGPLEGEITDTWGVNPTEESLVVEGTATEFGFGVKDARVFPLGNGKSIKMTERYPTPAESGIIYTLEGQEYDESSKAVIDTVKSLVDASMAKSLANALRDDGGMVEVRPLDKWHSILISAKIIDLPPMQEWDETLRIDLPNKLVSVGVVWDAKQGSFANAGGVDNIPLIQADNLRWEVKAQVQASGSCFGAPFIEIEPGYNGVAVARVTREFFDAPPALTSANIHLFRPVTGILTIKGFSIDSSQVSTKSGIGETSFGSDLSNRFDRDNKLSISNFGPFEHDGLETTVTNLGDSPNVVVTITATGGSTPSAGIYPAASVTINETASATVEFPTSSIPLVSGDTYVANVVVRPWRAGKWVRETYTVTVP